MSQTAFANTPEPPYYAVMFTSLRNGADAEGYAEAAERMLELAAQQPYSRGRIFLSQAKMYRFPAKTMCIIAKKSTSIKRAGSLSLLRVEQ